MASMITYPVRDFIKAFSNVDMHQCLLVEFEHYGSQGHTQNWMKVSYLIGNKHVVLEGDSTNEVGILLGVPQGCALDPYLFLYYINDMSDNIISRIRFFADDTIIYT